MDRDIGYAAVAVHGAIVEKFARQTNLAGLEVIAGERTIELRHAGRAAVVAEPIMAAVLLRSGK